ncbi:MAG: hypothetical protein PHV02_19575 [Rhodocyclaceae bacterium]|nr:hypothetical protein [Rhodocyclaceae bacterium]
MRARRLIFFSLLILAMVLPPGRVFGFGVAEVGRAAGDVAGGESVVLGGRALGVINDAFGNGVAASANGTVSWNTARQGGYGPLPGCADASLENLERRASSLEQAVATATAWRSRRIDPSELYNLGARYYEPQGGRFLSADPLGHGASMSLYDYANGDPINGCDPDGRCPRGAIASSINFGPDFMSLAGSLQSWWGQNVSSRMNPSLGRMETAMGMELREIGDKYAQYNRDWVGGNPDSFAYKTGEWAPAVISVGSVAKQGFVRMMPSAGKMLKKLFVKLKNGPFLSHAGNKGGWRPFIGVDSAAKSASPFESMLQKVESLDFSTPRNGAVFYSGPGQGTRASAFAERTGSMTIEMTPGGKALASDPVFQSLSPAEQYQVWKKASTPFAEGVSGHVNAFIKGARPTGTFRTVEEGIIRDSSDVTKTTYHY